MIGILAAGVALTGALNLTFEGLKPGGNVKVALFASEADWRGRVEAERSSVVQVTGATLTVEFDSLPPGDYGVMAYHDRNGNGRLDTLPIGLPTEPYGFSNNARGTFGPPGWARARIAIVAGAPQAQSIRLR